MPFVFNECNIKGLYEIQPEVYKDDRGYFLESYSEKEFKKAGIKTKFVQDNQSMSVKGTLRGLHFQKKHPQGKLIRVIEGEVFDVAVDLRHKSNTRGKWHSVILNGQKQNMFYIPPGFAHGFLALSDKVILTYKCTDFYYPYDETGIIWNDPDIGIEWPNLGMDNTISEKDKNLPRMNNMKQKGNN